MKNKFNISKRILSLVLVFVMVVGLLPMEVFAAPSEATTITHDNSGQYDYSENLVAYYKYNNFLYKTVYSNIKNISKTGLAIQNDNLMLAGASGIYLQTIANQYNNYTATSSNLPQNVGESSNLYIRGGSKYGVDGSKPAVAITCVGVGKPTWSWNGTSSATAKFTSTDGNATMTVNAAITSSTAPAANCLETGIVTYTATATANGQTYTDTKTADGDFGPHSYTYFASGNTVTETCNNCSHSETAKLLATDADHTGSAITTGASVTYSDGWGGSRNHGKITYYNNVDAGDSTAKVTVAGK